MAAVEEIERAFIALLNLRHEPLIGWFTRGEFAAVVDALIVE